MKKLLLRIKLYLLRRKGSKLARRYAGAVEEIAGIDTMKDFAFTELACPEVMMDRLRLKAITKQAIIVKKKIDTRDDRDDDAASGRPRLTY